jgi:NADH-quinone oxidoreductase subunit H
MFILVSVVKIVLTLFILLTAVAYTVWLERKVVGHIQNRWGPTRVGPFGLLQPMADGVKFLFKEDLTPPHVYKPLYIAAPMIAVVFALTSIAVIPVGNWVTIGSIHTPLEITDVNIGLLVVLGLTSMGVYGIALSGWSSNNKYSLLGGLRASAQMVSYEIALGLSLVGVLILSSSFSLREIVDAQGGHFWGFIPRWNLFQGQFVAFFIYLMAAYAETNRIPFDLPEAETELVAGYHTEYSAMKFSLFFIAEYGGMVTASALMATLFFGGWDVPFTARDNIGPFSGWLTLLSIGIMLTKMLFFIFLFMWIRWTLPRFRYDQLMSLGWKFMLPLALTYIVLIAAVMLGLSAAGIEPGLMYAAILGSLNVGLVIVLFAILDRGRLISPAYGRMHPREIERMRQIDRRRLMTAPPVTEGGR